MQWWIFRFSWLKVQRNVAVKDLAGVDATHIYDVGSPMLSNEKPMGGVRLGVFTIVAYCAKDCIRMSYSELLQTFDYVVVYPRSEGNYGQSIVHDERTIYEVWPWVPAAETAGCRGLRGTCTQILKAWALELSGEESDDSLLLSQSAECNKDPKAIGV